MGDPDGFVSELGTEGALRLRTVVMGHNLASLHHEIRDDSWEVTILEM